MQSLAQSIFTILLREAPPNDISTCSVRGEMCLFQKFNRLIDEKYRQHLMVPEYATMLGMSESRLTELCRRFANQSPKRLIFERVSREARRLLLYSEQSINQIALDLATKIRLFRPFFQPNDGLPTNTIPWSLTIYQPERLDMKISLRSLFVACLIAPVAFTYASEPQ